MMMPNSTNQTDSMENGVISPKVALNARPVPYLLKLLRLGFQIGGRLSPTIAGGIAYSLWFRPGRKQTPASEQQTLASAEIEHLEIKNHSIATYRWGKLSGPTVLLVHGWGGRGTQLGAFVKPLLESGYRVLSFDAPAHGRSSGKKTNIYEVADVIVALQHNYGLFDAVITHSFGGPCTAIAMRRGLRTKRLVSISPPSSTVRLVEKFLSTLRIPEKAGRNMKVRFEKSFGPNLWDELSMVNSIQGVTIPGLLFHDSNDDVVPWQDGESVARAWNNARFIKTTGLGHRRILRDRNVIESAVRFLNDSELPLGF